MIFYGKYNRDYAACFKMQYIALLPKIPCFWMVEVK
jgi:hypothetical protein